jgi:hypothetical protein
MPCRRCNNPEYPEVFDTKPEPRFIGSKYCKVCGYPGLSKTDWQRIIAKALKVSPLIPGPGLKGIDAKYWSETLDSKARPLDVLDPLRVQWTNLDRPTGGDNFYDWLAEVEGDATVLQLQEGQRAPYLATIAGGELAAESVTATNMEYAFVLAPDGAFYAGPKKTSGPLRLHHSSFLAGRPVKCAGVFFCATNVGEHKRKITYVKDYSGHYQPGIPEILRLKERLVELGEGAIELRFYGTGHVAKYQGPISAFTGKGAGLNEL